MVDHRKDKDWWWQYRDDDPVARLLVHYFAPCDLMYKQKLVLNRRISRARKPSRKTLSDELSYTKLWLGTLLVVCQGFKDLKLSDDSINSIIDDHIHSLNLFRNGVFHYQKKPDKLVQFLKDNADTFGWAETLHRHFLRFESNYKVNNAVKNLLAENAA